MENQELVQKYFDELIGFTTKKIHKKTVRRIVALAVVVCLFFGLLGFLIGRASAFSVGSDSDLDTVILSGRCIYPQFVENSLTAVSQKITTLNSNVLVIQYFGSTDQDYSCYAFVCENGELCIGSDGFVYVSEPLTTVYRSSLSFSSWSENGFGLASQVSYSTSDFDILGTEFYTTDFSINNFFLNNGVVYCSNTFLSGGAPTSANLDISAYLPDTRILQCYRYDIYGSDYIRVAASDRLSNLVSITFNYSDSYGTFNKVFLYDEILNMDGSVIAPAPLLLLQFEPSLITSNQFTLNSCTWTAAGSYGTKTISDLNLVFNNNVIETDPDYQNITYVSNFTEALSGAGWITGSTTIYGGYITDSPVGLWYWDIDNSINQPFGCRVFFIPDYLFNFGGNDLANFTIQNYYSLFEQFDVIVAGIPESYFDFLYGSGAYQVGKTNFLIHGIDFALNEILAASEGPHCLPFENINDSLTITHTAQGVGLLYNRSFLLKQILYSFGDVDSRLLEFESNLLGEDGVLAGIQEQWVKGYELDSDFYINLLSKLSDLGYAINGLSFGDLGPIGEKLDRIIGYLDFDLQMDLSKLSEPWLSIFTFAKNMFEDSEPMWDSIGSGASVLYDGLPVSNQYDVEQLPAITGPIPLYPTIAPVPLIPTFSPTPIPLGGG